MAGAPPRVGADDIRRPRSIIEGVSDASGRVKIHDVMDEPLTEREVQGEVERDFTMTTWHAEESLEDALEFFKNCALDHDLQDWRTAPGVIALIGRPDLVTQIETFPFD